MKAIDVLIELVGGQRLTCGLTLSQLKEFVHVNGLQANLPQRAVPPPSPVDHCAMADKFFESRVEIVGVGKGTVYKHELVAAFNKYFMSTWRERGISEWPAVVIGRALHGFMRKKLKCEPPIGLGLGDEAVQAFLGKAFHGRQTKRGKQRLEYYCGIRLREETIRR